MNHIENKGIKRVDGDMFPVGDMKKFEGTDLTMAKVYNRVVCLIEENKDRCSVHINENDFLKSMSVVFKLKVGESDEELLRVVLSVTKEHARDELVESINIGSGNDGGSLYRLDISSGDEVVENYNKFKSLVSRFGLDESKANAMLEPFVTTKEGVLVNFVDGYSESAVLAEDILELLSGDVEVVGVGTKDSGSRGLDGFIKRV